MQKIKRKYRTVKAVGSERTDERTHESEFIGSLFGQARGTNKSVTLDQN